MSTFKKVLFFFLLPTLGTLLYPPEIIGKAYSAIGIVALFFLALTAILWRGNLKALTFMIFLNGMNVIVRIMMLLSTTVSRAGVMDLPFLIYGFLGAAISFYLMLRLDKVDFQQAMMTH
jgi:hypothetical protein